MIQSRGAYAALSIRLTRHRRAFPAVCGSVECPAARLALHSYSSIVTLFWCPRVAAADVDTSGTVGCNRCCPYQVHLFVHVVLGPFGHLGLVRRYSVAGNQLEREIGSSARGRRSPCEFSFLFPDQQFRGLGCMADVSEDFQRPDDVIRRRPAIFPRDSGKRFVLLYRD